MSNQERLHALDAVRAFALLSGIVLHATMSFFLPIPAVLIYYFGAPILCVIVTMGFFFTNVILGMSGASIRTLIAFFALSVIVHLLMLAVFII